VIGVHCTHLHKGEISCNSGCGGERRWETIDGGER